MAKIYNRTPHALTIVRGKRRVELPAPAPDGVARVEVRPHEVGDVGCEALVGVACRGQVVPIIREEWGEIVGLPDPEPGVFHVVSRVVAAAACCGPRGGRDLLVPASLRRGRDGRVDGCTALGWASTSLPGLEDVR